MGNKRNLSGAAVIVMSSVVVSRLTGFVREMLVPNLMDSSSSDAYNMAFKITGLLYDMLVGGAIAAALIPILTGFIAKDREKEGWKVAGTFINAVCLASIAACIIGIIFARPLVRIFAFGYKGLEVEELTVRLTRILFPSVVFIMLAGLVNGVLNSYNRFAAAAYGPSIYNIGSCISIALFGGKSLPTVAWGVVISSFIYFLFQLSFALKNMKYYRFKIHLKHAGFKKLVKLAIPSLISSSIVQVNLLISSAFATLFTVGSVTALNMADKTWQMPFGVIAQGIGIAILPTLSANLATGNVKQYKTLLFKALRIIIMLTMPAAMALIVLNRDIVSAIFRFSSGFNPEYIPMAGKLLAFFSLALLFQSIVTVMNRAFYASNDTKTPLVCGIITIIINIMLTVILYFIFRSVGVIAIAYSLSSVINCLLLLNVMNVKMKGIYLKQLTGFTIKSALASNIMAIVIVALKFIFPLPVTKIMELYQLFIKTLIGMAVYFMASFALGMTEIGTIFKRGIKKLSKTQKIQKIE